jgi:putative tricarboxylic transport membrane protein
MSSASAPGTPAPLVGRPARGRPWGEALFAVGLVALGVFTLVEASGIIVPGSANVMGPQAFPYAVGALLVGTGAAVLLAIVRGHRGQAEQGEDVDVSIGTDWVTVGKLIGSFVALIVLVEPLGWPLAATLLFTGAAWSLGAKPWWRPAVIGLVLSLVVQVTFTQLLGVYLPAGLLDGVPSLNG